MMFVPLKFLRSLVWLAGNVTFIFSAPDSGKEMGSIYLGKKCHKTYIWNFIGFCPIKM